MCIYLRYQLFQSDRNLEYDSLSTFVCVFSSKCESLMVDRMYQFLIFLLVGWHSKLDLFISVTGDFTLFGIVEVFM